MSLLPNPIKKLKNNVIKVYLTTRQDKRTNKFFLIDSIDYEKIKNYKWRSFNNYSLVSALFDSNNKKVKIQDTIIKPKSNYHIVFKNKNIFDFRRENLVQVPLGINSSNFKNKHIIKPEYITNLNELNYSVSRVYQPSPYVILKNKIKITLLNSSSEIVGYTFVSKEDENIIKNIRWSLYSSGYAYNPNIGFLHRLICPTEKGYIVDHINHDRLDNTRQNLRSVLVSVNSSNKEASKFPICISQTKSRGFILKMTLPNNNCIRMQLKTLMSAICVKNFYIEKYNISYYEKEDLLFWQEKLKTKICKITNEHDITKYRYTVHENKRGIFGIISSRNKIKCRISLISFKEGYLYLTGRLQETPNNILECAYKYNKVTKLINEKFNLCKPLNNIKNLCKKYNISKTQFLQLKENWKLDENTLKLLNSLKYKPQKMKIIILDNKKTVILYSKNLQNPTIFDYNDYIKVSNRNWSIDSTGYAYSNDGLKLHRVIMNLTPESKEVVNHKNHIRWDNRRKNLEILSFEENAQKRITKEARLKLEKELLNKINNAKFIKE